MSGLTGCRFRVEWAKDSLAELRAERARLMEDGAYTIRVQRRSREDDWVTVPPDHASILRAVSDDRLRPNADGTVSVRVVVSEDVDVFAVENTPLPLARWGVVFGNIVHNLRSALDNLVYVLSVAHQRTIGLDPDAFPYALKSGWRHISFPVCNDRANWKSVCATQLKLIDPDLCTFFQELQPFDDGNFRQDFPEFHPFALLQDLWNRDKHHELSVVAANAELVEVSLFDRSKTVQLFDWGIEYVLPRYQGVLQDRTPLTRLRLTPNDPFRAATMTENIVQVQAQVRFEIHLPEGPPGHDREVTNLLDELTDATERVLDRFEPFVG